MSTLENSTAPAPLSPGARIVAAYVSPTSLFQDIKRSASWWPAFLLLAVVTLLFCFAVQRQVGWGHAYDTMLHQQPKQEQRFSTMTPAQVAQAKSLGAKITQISSYASPVLILVISAVASGVLLGTLNFGFGGKARYSEVFAVYMYAGLPYVISSLLATVALFAGLDSGSFLISNPVGSNLGYYLSPDSAKWLLALASSFDLFTLWVLVLLVLGCSIVARVSRSSAAIAVAGWWLLIVIIKVGAAALQS